MPIDEWLPVNPARHRTEGWLTALEPWLEKGGAMPVRITVDDLHPGSWDVDIEVRSSSTRVFAKLGVSAIVDSSASWDSSTASLEALVGVRKVLPPASITDESAIYETLWAVGLRVLLTAKTTEIGLDVNVGTVAAMAEYRSANVQYEIHGIGLGPERLGALLKGFSPFGSYDISTQYALDKARKALVKELKTELKRDADTLARLQPVLVKVAPKKIPEDMQDDFQSGAIYRFAMTKIAAGMSFDAAVAHMGQFHVLDMERLRTLYLELADVKDPTATPNGPARGRAYDWLVVPI